MRRSEQRRSNWRAETSWEMTRDSERFGPEWLGAELLVAGMLAFALLGAERLGSGKFDSAPRLTLPSALVNSGRSVLYGKPFDTPRKPVQTQTIILPIASCNDGCLQVVGRRPIAKRYPFILVQASGRGSSAIISPPAPPVPFRRLPRGILADSRTPGF